MGLGLLDGLDELVGIGAHGALGYVDVVVGHEHQAEIFLPAAWNCATAPTGVALEDWPPVLE